MQGGCQTWTVERNLCSLFSTRSFGNGNNITVSFSFLPRAKPRLTPGMNLTLCSVQCGDVGAEWYSLLWCLNQNFQGKQVKSTFPSCIKCIKWLQLMILHYIIKAKLQGSRWPSDVISPPKSVGKSVILMSSENKFWWLQSTGFSKAGSY